MYIYAGRNPLSFRYMNMYNMNYMFYAVLRIRFNLCGSLSRTGSADPGIVDPYPEPDPQFFSYFFAVKFIILITMFFL